MQFTVVYKTCLFQEQTQAFFIFSRNQEPYSGPAKAQVPITIQKYNSFFCMTRKNVGSYTQIFAIFFNMNPEGNIDCCPISVGVFHSTDIQTDWFNLIIYCYYLFFNCFASRGQAIWLKVQNYQTAMVALSCSVRSGLIFSFRRKNE